MTVRVAKMDMVAGGIWNERDTWRSMLRAWVMVKLLRWDCEAISRMDAAQIGSILIMVLSSSTLWTVASLHRFGLFDSFMSESDSIAARSIHLWTSKHIVSENRTNRIRIRTSEKNLIFFSKVKI